MYGMYIFNTIPFSFYTLVYMDTFVRKIDDIEALMQSTHVHTRCVHDNLHEHVCMSVAYTWNLVHMQVDVYIYKL